MRYDLKNIVQSTDAKMFKCYKEEVKNYRCESCCNLDGKCFWYRNDKQ